ncbi:hypothetical protein [Ureibacillus sp. FSL K6-3587]|uniref:hypothetical protein n=1 Tax=Ureibacillus sp. FSL K6-3587 TaxID=2954681 RepID=UPI0031585C97
MDISSCHGEPPFWQECLGIAGCQGSAGVYKLLASAFGVRLQRSAGFWCQGSAGASEAGPAGKAPQQKEPPVQHQFPPKLHYESVYGFISKSNGNYLDEIFVKKLVMRYMEWEKAVINEE